MVGSGGPGTEIADPLDAVAAVGAGFFGGGGTPTALIGTGTNEATDVAHPAGGFVPAASAHRT